MSLDEPFQCLVCQRRFSHWVGVNRHLNQTHGISGKREVSKNYDRQVEP